MNIFNSSLFRGRGSLYFALTTSIIIPIMCMNQKASCPKIVKIYSTIDLAKEAFINIKNLHKDCERGITTHSSNVTKSYPSLKEKLDTLIDEAIVKIRLAKRKFMACKGPTLEEKLVFPSRTPLDRPGVDADHPTDCLDFRLAGHTVSGVYTIAVRVPGRRRRKLMDVYCDMKTMGGGWTVIQRRDNYTVQENFYRSWQKYKEGFGNLTRDFWLGNDNIFYLTNQVESSVRFDLEDDEGKRDYALYDEFRIADESRNYQLFIDGYSGWAGNAMEYHNGTSFSTVYRKHDRDRSEVNCADRAESGWWFHSCARTNPNGVYQPGATNNRHRYMYWFPWREYKCLKSVQIKIREIDKRRRYAKNHVVLLHIDRKRTNGSMVVKKTVWPPP